MSMAADPTEALAAFVANLRLDDVPAPVRERAADLLLDAVVCALAADHAEDLAPFGSMVDAIDPAHGDATVLGSHERRSAAAAVLLNGFRITAVTACDVYAPAEMHSTPAVVPPALALAERDGASGADLLRAVVVGLETATRIARSFDRPTYRERGWHSPGIIGPFGGAAAGAAILGLPAEIVRNALAIAGSQAAGTWAQRGTPTVKFHQARAAHAGLMSALLAASEFGGASRVFTAPEGGLYTAIAAGDPELATAALGEHWELMEISVRLFPGGARVQPAVAAAIAALGGSALDPDSVSAVEVRVAPDIARAQAWAASPTSTFAALASIHFGVALTLHDGAAAPAGFTAERYGDPSLQAFMAERLTVVPDDDVPTLGARVRITTADGRILDGAVDRPRGDPRTPATRDELATKAHRFGDERLGSAVIDELVERMRSIDREPDVRPLLAIVRGAPDS